MTANAEDSTSATTKGLLAKQSLALEALSANSSSDARKHYARLTGSVEIHTAQAALKKHFFPSLPHASCFSTAIRKRFLTREATGTRLKRCFGAKRR